MFKSGKFGELAVCLLIFATGFLFRCWHLTSTGWVEPSGENALLGMRLANSSPFHFSDADYYLLIANDVLAGKGMNIPFPPPFTIWTLVFLFSIFGKDYFAAKIVYAVLGSLSLVFIYLSSRELYGKGAALLASLFCSISFPLIFITGGLNTENIYLFTTSLAVSLFIFLYMESGVAGKRPILFAFLFGLSASAAVLTRSEFAIVIAIFFFFGLFRKGWTPGKKAGIAASAFAGFVLLITPWAARNYQFMSSFNKNVPAANLPLFVPISLNGPFNFLEGHHELANGTYSPMVTGVEEASIVRLNPGSEKHLAMVRDGFSMGKRYILENIGKEISLVPFKTGLFLDGFSNGFMLNNFPAGLNGKVNNIADSFVPYSKAAFWLGGLFFLLGIAELARLTKNGLIRFAPVMILAVPLLISISFYALVRMAFPFLPFFFMVISLGIFGPIQRYSPLSTERFRHAVIFLYLVCLAIGAAQSTDFRIMEKRSLGGPLGGFELALRAPVK